MSESQVRELIRKAAECPVAHEAIQFSQAALNAAHALRELELGYAMRETQQEVSVVTE